MANEPPSTLHSKRRVITGSLLVKLKAIESKPVVAPINGSTTVIRNFGCKCCNGRRSPVDGPCKDRRRYSNVSININYSYLECMSTF